MSFNSTAKAKIVDEFQRSSGDTGSVEVQVALLTARIKYLTGHLKEHPKDFHTRRGLVKLVSKRRSLLKYLRKKDHGRFIELVTRLEIRH